jgi:hypothetical protein
VRHDVLEARIPGAKDVPFGNFVLLKTERGKLNRNAEVNPTPNGAGASTAANIGQSARDDLPVVGRYRDTSFLTGQTGGLPSELSLAMRRSRVNPLSNDSGEYRP